MVLLLRSRNWRRHASPRTYEIVPPKPRELRSRARTLRREDEQRLR